jgi:hypothetical protein
MKPEFTSALLNTTIICVNKVNEDLGMEPEEVSMKICIDLREIIAVRESQEDDGPIVVLYSSGDSWAVHGDYDQVLRQWKAFKNL